MSVPPLNSWEKLMLIWLLIDVGTLGITYQPQHELVEAASAYPWPVIDSLGIAWCESFHKLTAWNGYDAGAWQINEYWWRDVFGEQLWSQRFTARGSAHMGYHVWETGGDSFKWWTCGRYK